VEESFHLAEVRVLAQRMGARRIWLIPGEGVALGGDPVRLRKALRLPEHRLRAVQGRTLLLVHEAAFPKASHVLAFLRSALQEVASGGARG
jgi:hypothetical protein